MKNGVLVIGAGASGLMAAGRAAELGAGITLLERMESPGRKLLITGLGRCNLSNIRELSEFTRIFGENGNFLFPAFKNFFRDDLLSFLSERCVPTYSEPDGRVFPVSGKSGDVLDALIRYTRERGVTLVTGARVTRISVDKGKVDGIFCADAFYPAGAVILAAGGSSYPQTGSSGDGFEIAADLGHRVVTPRPALVPLTIRQVELCRALQGVSLSNIRLTAWSTVSGGIPEMKLKDCGRGLPGKPKPPVLESRRGDLVFTHNGVSGPAVLLSSLAVVDALKAGSVSLSLDLFPDFSHAELENKLRGLFADEPRKILKNVLSLICAQKLAMAICGLSGIMPEKQAHQVTAEERKKLVNAFKSLNLDVNGSLGIAEAMVTAGGVSLEQVDPRTMSSKLVNGLYLCGEVLDLDAETGGYNLQAAFSTGYLAGESAAAFALGSPRA